ncbi:hypothetical protein QAD02_020589 [Eretmocerus hayati]|uniref:Uncharacterized protein n=1 Tax=Eretmocerus hayati TaxID=131215 RepID=A0ACC2PP49_9HYME|nr:hypothetical protein QAD02_020589 [Eretmocerus hayati]
MEAGVEGGSQNRLFMRDLNSGRLSLQDTGADISLISRDRKLRTKPSGFLYAVNGPKVIAYGESLLMIRFPGIKREFPWKFRVADIDSMIIGGDFLKHYKLMVDLDGTRLVNKETGPYGLGTCKPSSHVSIRSVDPNPVSDARVNSMLSESLEITDTSDILFDVEIRGNVKSVSVNLLKPAYIISEDLEARLATDDQPDSRPPLRTYSGKKNVTFPSTGT